MRFRLWKHAISWIQTTSECLSWFGLLRPGRHLPQSLFFNTLQWIWPHQSSPSCFTALNSTRSSFLVASNPSLLFHFDKVHELALVLPKLAHGAFLLVASTCSGRHKMQRPQRGCKVWVNQQSVSIESNTLAKTNPWSTHQHSVGLCSHI